MKRIGLFVVVMVALILGALFRRDVATWFGVTAHVAVPATDSAIAWRTGICTAPSISR